MAQIIINVKRLNDKAHLPKFMTRYSISADLVAMSVIKNGIFKVQYDCQIKTEIPRNHVGLIFPQNSIINKPLVLTNSVGIIDPDYRDTYRICFNRTFWGIFTRKQYKVGEKIAQLLILKVENVKYKDIKFFTNKKRGI